MRSVSRCVSRRPLKQHAGCWIDGTGDERRYLDDYLHDLHDVPDPVYDLLVEVGAQVRRPLTVILERDGRFPPMSDLLWQLDRARAALAQGRLRAARDGAATRMSNEA